MTHTTHRFTIGPNPPARLDKALARDVPEALALSRTRLAQLLGAGAVRVDGALAQDAKARVAEGAEVEITLAEAAEVDTRPEAIPLEILHEDADLLVVMKPAGMVVHPAPGSPSGTLVNALLHHFGGDLSGIGGEKRPGIVHRIDKDTSGLLVVAKSDRAHHALSEQFAAHSVERRYLALVHGVPHTGDPRLKGVRGVSFEPGAVMKITTGLARHRSDRQKQAVYFDGQGRHAVTRARMLESFGNPAALALMECRLETGRTHQIRVHMAHAGFGLVGDPVYGGRRRLSPKAVTPEALAAIEGFSRQALHAASLGFAHPADGAWMSFEAPLPEDMAALLGVLGGGR
ncbi:RluA family pseudouridine synthase [Roseivivax sp. GX 12232]|uniref:RluA family pseudouridine synthase n=1 Tax=Roseivivax sp. GX 12232 TaxID=2900547 RepID=UPI001E5F034A|nr:RluA family pseudouridine synthase [Roseivivax sp. GX 12232]MCE0505261.1 RluA family pseudouridine synthase [Roseivivax sp. GX 12232]